MSNPPFQTPSPDDFDMASTQPDPRTSVAEVGAPLRYPLLDPPLKPGDEGSLDRYSILRQIGGGGMGLVFLGRHPVTESAVAIKIIRPQLLEDPRSVHRFLTEARHMSRLSHPNLLKVMDVSDRAAGPYYVMPFMERGSLAKLLGTGKPLELAATMQIAREIAGALAHAHEKGIIHRDLKPANVLLDEGGHACLSDFGLVRTVFNDSIVDVRLSQCEGTAAYMSPAVARGAAEDTRCDIYAFGAMLYEMLTGQLPYEGRSSREVIEKVLAGPPEPILLRNPLAHAGLAAIAEGAMGRELRDRYSSMADVTADLERVERGQPPLGPHGGVPAAPSASGSSAVPVPASLHAAAPDNASSAISPRGPAAATSPPPAANRKSFSVQANLRSIGCTMTIAMGLLITVGVGIVISRIYAPELFRRDVARGPSTGAPDAAPLARPSLRDMTAHPPDPIVIPPPFRSADPPRFPTMAAAGNPVDARRGGLGSNDLLNAHNAAPAFSVKLATADGKAEYVEGESPGFKVTATQRCYLTLIAQDSDGKVTLLLPNRWQPHPIAAPGEPMWIPDKAGSHRLPAGTSVGVTLIKLIATTEPLDLILGPENPSGCRELPRGAKVTGLARPDAGSTHPAAPTTAPSPRFLKELLDDSKWATAELTIEIKPRPEPPPGAGM